MAAMDMVLAVVASGGRSPRATVEGAVGQVATPTTEPGSSFDSGIAWAVWKGLMGCIHRHVCSVAAVAVLRPAGKCLTQPPPRGLLGCLVRLYGSPRAESCYSACHFPEPLSMLHPHIVNRQVFIYGVLLEYIRGTCSTPPPPRRCSLGHGP